MAQQLLTDAEMHDLISGNPFTLGLSIARLKDFIRQVEKAVVTKQKAEQRPVAWRVHPFDNGAGIEGAYAITQEEALAESWRHKGWKVTPLYAHPQTEMQKPFTPRNAAEMRDFIGMHFGLLRYANPETEEPSDDDWYTLSIHDLLSAFSWAGYYDHEGLSATSRDATTPDGWQLVPVKPTEAMLNQGESEWTIRYEANRAYRAMLAAAPKYGSK